MVRRADWPRGAALGHAAMVGLLLQGARREMYAGISLGMPVGVAGLVVGLIPVATALGAAPLLGEPFTRRRAMAAALGLGAVLLVVGEKLAGGRAAGGTVWGLAAIALGGGAGAALWQKRFGGGGQGRGGQGRGGQGLGAAAVQLAAGTAVMAVCWALLERGGSAPIDWSAAFLGPFLWTVLANSVGATLLLLWLLGRGAAGRVDRAVLPGPAGDRPGRRLAAGGGAGAASWPRHPAWGGGAAAAAAPAGRRSRAAGCNRISHNSNPVMASVKKAPSSSATTPWKPIPAPVIACQPVQAA